MNTRPSGRIRVLTPLWRGRTGPSLLGMMYCCALGMIGISAAVGQEPPGSQKPSDEKKVVTVIQEPHESEKPADIKKTASMRAVGCDLGCRCCHTCDRPTPENQCLPGCERGQVDFMHGLQGPDMVILGELEDTYLPVPFDHKGHARMAEMTKGCVACHHYTPEGRQHPACKTCHAVDAADTSIRKPGLKGAYHRQCLGCHRNWIDETDCAICHQRKAAAGPNNGVPILSPSPDDILGRMHPPITEPGTEIYRAESKEGATSVVIFRHWEHVNSFDLRCVECHHEENCTRCHKDQRGNGGESPPTIKEHHEPCQRCHQDDMNESTTEIAGKCKRCHWQEGDPRMKPFEHTDTGWALSKYHEASSCRACHKKVPFRKLDRNCNTCHSKWEPDNFNHIVTGQVLDDTHKEIDCADCHTDRKFDAPPTCEECHDEDEGIAFPTKRPGPVLSSPEGTKPEED